MRHRSLFAAIAGFVSFAAAVGAQTGVSLGGRVQAGGKAVSGSTVIAYAAGAGAPAKLGEAKTDAQGAFTLSLGAAPAGSSVYIVAKGGTPAARPDRTNNAALAFLAVLGATPPRSVTINEFTTVASVWTNAQFLEGEALRGHPLGLKIAAGNVPSFVDLSTGGWGGVIQDPLNGPQTPTMANFATLADLLSACATRLTPDACGRLYAASTPPKGPAPTDTLTAAIAVARNSWYQPQRLFQLLDAFYTIPKGKTMRGVPFMPYLVYPPSAWVLPLRFDGGGYVAGERLRGRRPPDADRHRGQPVRRRLGHEQLAGRRQLLRRSGRGALDPLRGAGRDDLLRPGQARARAADRPGEALLMVRGVKP